MTDVVPVMTDVEEEVSSLEKLAKIVIAYLLACALVSLFIGASALSEPSINQLLALSLLGFSGSATAALTSCLDRYSNGFELDNGNCYPVEATGGKFNKRFSAWFIVRPFLGAIVAPVFLWGLSLFGDNIDSFTDGKVLGFTAFMAGLLAKSVLELIKNLFKNVFRS